MISLQGGQLRKESLMKNEILKENLRHLIKNYGMDNTLSLCFELEKEGNNSYLPTLLSLTTQYYHRCRWIYDAPSGNLIDTWAPLTSLLEKRERTDLITLLKGMKDGKGKV